MTKNYFLSGYQTDAGTQLAFQKDDMLYALDAERIP